jgi:hypothetical protein
VFGASFPGTENSRGFAAGILLAEVRCQLGAVPDAVQQRMNHE